MKPERVVLTYKEYEALPADGRRYEIHDGELSITLTPSPYHQMISGNLTAILWPHIESRNLGEMFFAPIDCILSDTTIVQPDLVYLDTTGLYLVSDRGIEGAPTLVVEILSPSTTLIDRSTKHQLYSRYGVPYSTGSWTRKLAPSRPTAFHKASTSSSRARSAQTLFLFRHSLISL